MTPEAVEFVKHYENAYLPNDVDHTPQLTGGDGWYRASQQAARKIARNTGVTLSQAAGVIAAISPRMRWSANVAIAEDLCAGVQVQGVFQRNLDKARAILDGERPTKVLRGPKTNAFYRAIMGDQDAAVIDVWMLRAAGWDKKSLTPNEYNYVAGALREAAQYVGIDTADFQAIVWTQVRGGAE